MTKTTSPSSLSLTLHQKAPRHHRREYRLIFFPSIRRALRNRVAFKRRPGRDPPGSPSRLIVAVFAPFACFPRRFRPAFLNDTNSEERRETSRFPGSRLIKPAGGQEWTSKPFLSRCEITGPRSKSTSFPFESGQPSILRAVKWKKKKTPQKRQVSGGTRGISGS